MADPKCFESVFDRYLEVRSLHDCVKAVPELSGGGIRIFAPGALIPVARHEAYQRSRRVKRQNGAG